MKGPEVPVHIKPQRAEVRGVCCSDQLNPPSKPGLPPWGPHVRFRRVLTLVREGSPLVKLRNSA